MPGQMAPALSEMPSDGDWSDVQDGCDRRCFEFLELIHHYDGTPARRQLVECLPHDCVGHERIFGMIVMDDGTRCAVVASADFLSAPLIAADVDQDADEPRLFIRHSAGNGFGRPGGFEERFLNEVEGVVDARR